MATVSFNGSTIWSNASTGIGNVGINRVGDVTRWSVEPLPRANGSVAKNLGTDPGGLAITLDFHLDSSAISSLQSTLDGFVGDQGSLVVPPGQTHTYCILESHEIIRGPAVKNEAGSIVYFVRASLRFIKLR